VKKFVTHADYFVVLLLFFPLWLYSPILGLGLLHETFRFISVTRSRTDSRTPWTGLCVSAPGDCEDGEVGGMNGFGRGNLSTRRKPVPTPLCPPQISLARPERGPGPPQWETSDLPLQLWRGQCCYYSEIKQDTWMGWGEEITL
jgi:hypothetical protein